MITDVLFKRYPDQWLHSDRVPSDLVTVLRQAALVLHEDVAPHLPNRDQLFEVAHKRLARELGAAQLAPGQTYEERCIRFLGEVYDLWNDAHASPDTFFKLRLSLVELLFREAEARLHAEFPGGDLKQQLSLIQKRVSPKSRSSGERILETLVGGIREINERFKEARLPFEYHNGIIQRIDDALTAAQIETPFWTLISDPKWKNVDHDMKEATDRRGSAKDDAAFFALKALESTIKIISDDLRVTRGTERGASEYIDNLVSSRNGRYIEVWEAEALKQLFREIRNAQGHGAGSAKPPLLTIHQSTFVIETAMAWVKSLVRRKP